MEPVSADEWVVLTWFYEIGWSESSFVELRGLGNREPDKIPRLQAALASLLARGCITVATTNDRLPPGGELDSTEGQVAIKATDHWTGDWEPGFDPTADYFVARATENAQALYWKERQQGRPYIGEVDVAVLD